MTITRLQIPPSHQCACRPFSLRARWCLVHLRAPKRPNDSATRDVKILVDRIDEGRDKFEGNLTADSKDRRVKDQRKPVAALQTTRTTP
jgi:hypothetical protein